MNVWPAEAFDSRRNGNMFTPFCWINAIIRQPSKYLFVPKMACRIFQWRLFIIAWMPWLNVDWSGRWLLTGGRRIFARIWPSIAIFTATLARVFLMFTCRMSPSGCPCRKGSLPIGSTLRFMDAALPVPKARSSVTVKRDNRLNLKQGAISDKRVLDWIALVGARLGGPRFKH